MISVIKHSIFLIFSIISLINSATIDMSSDKHYLFAFTVNAVPHHGQYITIIDSETSKIVKNVSVVTPNDFVISGLLGMDKSENILYLLAGSGNYNSNALFSYNVNSGQVTQIEQMVPLANVAFIEQPYIFAPPNGNAYMGIQPLFADSQTNYLGLVEYAFSNGTTNYIKFNTGNFSQGSYPLVANNPNNQELYVVYSPAENSDQTNLMFVDLYSPKQIQKQFNQIQNISSSASNSMLLTSPNGNVYLIQTNNEINGIIVCEIQVSESGSDDSGSFETTCNFVKSIDMVDGFFNSAYYAFQTTLDNSGFLLMNQVSDTDQNVLVRVYDLNTWELVNTFTIKNYFNINSQALSYYISYN